MKILYHADCLDGFGAAFAAWMKFGDMAEYIPVQYGKEPPEIRAGEIVYILDFSYSRVQLQMMTDLADDIVVLDHHQTAERALAKPFKEPNITVHFDMTKSGAVLAWEHFHELPVPNLLYHVQDRDLWQFKMEGTKAITAALRNYESFDEWKTFITNPYLIQRILVPAGNGIIKTEQRRADDACRETPVFWELERETVPVYNLPPYAVSDTLHMALSRYPQVPYAVSYHDQSVVRTYSLRSRSGSDIDVSEIARKHGGGGHKHAAEFTIPIGKITSRLRSLADWNRSCADTTEWSQRYPQRNGLACPDCGSELSDMSALVTSSVPAERVVGCLHCGYRGMRLV